jgi:putative endonuclease
MCPWFDSEWHHLKQSECVSESEHTRSVFPYSHYYFYLYTMKCFYIYSIVSEKDGVIYVGIATDCQKRLKEHNTGKSKYTSGHKPWRLFYSELVGDAVTARGREKYFKSAAGKRKLKSILKSEG